LVGALEVGGAELDIVRNFPRLNRDEFDVVVVSFGDKGTLGPELERLGIQVVARKKSPCMTAPDTGLDAPTSGGAPATTRGSSAWKAGQGRVGRLPHWLQRIVRPVFAVFYMAAVTMWVARIMASEKVDIMHAFLPHAYAYGVVGCVLGRPRAKTVMSRLSLNFYTTNQPLLAWMERNVLHDRVDIAIGNSVKILDELVEEGVDPSKTRLLYNGIDPAPFSRQDGDRERARVAMGLPQDAFVAVAVGNLHGYKGHRDLIEACAAVGSELPQPWRVLIAGRDETGNRAAYQALIQNLGLAENIRLLGPCDDVPQLLTAADVFVHPSHHEGLPNAIIEAMASSLSVIGTAVGGIPELVTPAGEAEETGWVVPPCEPTALGRVLLEAAADPQLREAMGIRARERAEARFSLMRSVDSYEAIYREIVHT
jgi:glycosyltransferase involved in cell wall biosynthesis